MNSITYTCIYMSYIVYTHTMSGFHTEGPPEILKFIMVFGHLVCVIKIILLDILSRIASEAKSKI